MEQVKRKENWKQTQASDGQDTQNDSLPWFHVTPRSIDATREYESRQEHHEARAGNDHEYFSALTGPARLDKCPTTKRGADGNQSDNQI